MNPREQPGTVPWHPDAYGFWSEMRRAGDVSDADAPSDGDAAAAQVNRRSALGILAASVGLASLPSCRRPDIELRPYAKMPENVVPGMPLFYCTALTRGGSALPVLVETHEGRPTKVEGHPKFEATQGSSDAIAQAAILQLYDPDRLNNVRRDDVTSSWSAFDAFADPHFAELLKKNGKGLRILSDATPSPALKLLREHMRQVAPEAKWHAYESLNPGYAEQATRLLFGKPLRVKRDFRQPDVIVSLDADFLGAADHDAIANTRAFAERRTPDGRGMNRLYVLEPMLTLTGSMADHRLRLAAHAVADFAMDLARELKLFEGDAEWAAGSVDGIDQLLDGKLGRSGARSSWAAWAREIAADLQSHRGRSLIVAGPRQPPVVHALAQLMNLALGNVPRGESYIEVPEKDTGTLGQLAEDAASGDVNTLVIVGGNPAYDAPTDLQLADRLAKVPHTIRLGLYEDETARLCQWRLPAAHAFESWGDAETDDGDYLPVQPMIAPLYNGRSSLTLLAKLLRYETTEEYEIVQRSFAEQLPSLNDAPTFDRWVHDGLAQREPLPFKPELTDDGASGLRDLLQSHQATQVSADRLEVCFSADTSVCDGRFANLSWLQELPDPITKITWDNAALMSAETASGLNLETGDVVRLTLEDRSVEAPVLIQPGHADYSITLPLGYGRAAAGRVGSGVGFNAYSLRTVEHPFVAVGVEVQSLGKRHQFASTQQYDRLDDRDIAREETVEQFTQRAEHAAKHAKHAENAGDTKHAGEADKHPKDDAHAGHHGGHAEGPPLIEPPKLDGKHQWGMVIDLSRCVGCNACTVACQSENNIPVVGKEEVARGRAMHWIRVDRYYRGPEPDPEVIHEPVACVHCEDAPCEIVCPVNAAVHSPEGLNLQVYNRCVGTRYCSNNCPYKVRRFNFFDYNQRELDQLRLGPLGDSGMAETLKMQKNPDVTVRMRGVMEKCTYCVQRIERGKAGAKLASPGDPDYTLQDGQVVPACAQACPAQAIVFGDLSDETSRVSAQKQDPRRFDLLAEIGTKPRTSYLSRLRNPNPALEAVLETKENGA